MKQHLWITVASSFLVALAFISCSEGITNPLTPGSGIFRNDVVIKSDTLRIASDTTFLQRVAPDNRVLPIRQNFIGTDSNITAYGLLRFLPPVRDTINVLSAKVTLRFLSWRGASRGTLGFTAHKVNLGWSQFTTTWDTVQQAGFFESTVVRGAYDGALGSDTLLISFNLDTTLVREWHRSNDTSYGILLKPTATTTNLLRGFQAFIDLDTSAKFQPELQVIARNVAGSVTDTAKFAAGFDTFVANANPFTTPAERLLTQAGIAYRSVLRFNIGSLPPGAIINTAELLLERDPAMSKLSRFTSNPQPSVHALTDTNLTRFESLFSAVGSIKSGTTNTYTFDVRRQVQFWSNGQNHGLILRQPDDNEFATLDLFTFFSNEASNPSLRPRIIVKYTQFQSDKPRRDSTKHISQTEEL